MFNAVVLLTHDQHDVVGGTGVGVPCVVDVVGDVDVLVIWNVAFIESMQAFNDCVPNLEPHLTTWELGGARVAVVVGVEPRGTVVVALWVPETMATLSWTTVTIAMASSTASVGHVHKGLRPPNGTWAGAAQS